MADVRSLPEGMTARPLRLDDVAVIAALLEDAEAVDDTGEFEDADELAEWFGNERVDLPDDSRVVESADGALVAWATAIDLGNHREAFAVHLDGRVHTDARGRGIGRALLGWQLARASELHRSRRPDMPGRYRVNVPEAMRSLERLVQRAGLEPVRREFEMQRPLEDVAPVRPVAGVEIATFTWDRDEEIRRAHNVAFETHYGTAERDEHAWRSWFTGQRSFRPDLSRLALADGAVVGYALVYVFDAETRATGFESAYIGQIGVLPAARGRGVATAVTGAALAAAADDGIVRAVLQVDTENDTGALRLYEQLGFQVSRRQTTWAVQPPPLEA